MASFEKHYIEKLNIEWNALTRTGEPTLNTSPILFVSDGTGGLNIDHLYIKSLTYGLLDLTGEVIEKDVTGAANVGGENEVFKEKADQTLNFRTLKAGNGITITQNTDDLEIAASGINSYEVITTGTSTIINPLNYISEFIINTGGVLSTNLADGVVLGQKKILIVSSITSGGSLDITLNILTGSTITLNAVGQSIELVWTSQSKWGITTSGVIVA